MESARTPGRRQSDLPLLDREGELAELERAVARTAAGAGSTLVVEGGPGAGKTRLLRAAVELGRGAGLRVLAAQGRELAGDAAYGVVRGLFEPAVAGGDGTAWLAGPAAAAARVFGPGTDEEAAPFATLNGLYWLTVNASARGPLMLVVDDVHWADAPSLGFVRYLARRLEASPVLLVLAGRPAESDLLAELAADPATTTIAPRPLSPQAGGRLAEALLARPSAASFTAACHRATRGNPLLLVELVRALRAEGIVPDDAGAGAIDHVGPSAVARVVLVRLRRLGEDALGVAQAIAVLGAGAATQTVAALAGLDEGAVAEAIEALVDAEVVDAQPPLTLVHPIVRDAVYRELTPRTRDARHARAAEALRAVAAEPERIGAHLLLVAPRGLGWVVDVLTAAADDAARRGGLESAVVFLRRAHDERPDTPDFDGLLRLGTMESGIDARAAVVHLEAARRAAPDGAARARLGELITRMLVLTDPPEASAAARRARADLPGGSEDVDAALTAMGRHAGRFDPAALASRAAPAPARPGGAGEAGGPDGPDGMAGPGGQMLRAVLAWERALGGERAEACVAAALEALGSPRPSGRPELLTTTPLFTTIVATTVLVLADDPRAHGLWEEVVVEARRIGRVHAAIAGGVWQGWSWLRLGRLEDAEDALRSALEGPRRWGPGTGSVPAHAHAVLAEVLVERGDLAGARAALARGPQGPVADGEGAALCRCAELRLLVAEGRFDAAIAAGAAVRATLETVANPAWAPWRSVLAGALAQTGRSDAAVALATEELGLARAWGIAGPIGRALTALGSVRDDPGLLQEAVDVTRDAPARVEHAKALLALGGARCRAGQAAAARSALRDAHELAVRCGAGAVSLAAREELTAAGARPRAVVGGGVGSLSPSERRVAELAAAGRPNREIAQELYLSPKTVELHLSSSYRKLGIKARGELTTALDRAA